MRCTGIRKATQQECGSPVYRCKDCGNTGCNQGPLGACSHQAFRTARCNQCNKLGSQRPVQENEATTATA